MNQVILNLWQGKGILPTINQTSYDVGNETKFWKLIFVITTMLRF